MKLFLQGHTCRFAIEQLQLQLFLQEPLEQTDCADFTGEGAISSLHRSQKHIVASAKITWRGKTAYARRYLPPDCSDERLLRMALQQAYYAAAVKLLPTPPPWGALAGVRPTKLATRFLLQGCSPRQAAARMRRQYYVSPARSLLCAEAAQHTVKTIAQLAPQDISVYIGIPFCPTRCVYCSFVSVGMERSAGLLAPYLQALLQEIARTGALLEKKDLRIRHLYIGGGTPTSLNAVQLEKLLGEIQKHFDLSGLAEYTVECGRPDTLDAEKLHILHDYPVQRISINPQTMNDTVLKAIGRCHTARQTLDAYSMAQRLGFTDINMDLIAGLPGDTVDSFSDSLQQVLSLQPSNITVHTLALKKGAALFDKRFALPSADEVGQMLSGAGEALRRNGYAPYYLYRQKYSAGGFENVGWCTPGHACLYNICMMEELHSILSLGGGGMTKINRPNGSLQRFHNPKFPAQYIAQIDQVCATKETILERL